MDENIGASKRCKKLSPHDGTKSAPNNPFYKFPFNYLFWEFRKKCNFSMILSGFWIFASELHFWIFIVWELRFAKYFLKSVSKLLTTIQSTGWLISNCKYNLVFQKKPKKTSPLAQHHHPIVVRLVNFFFLSIEMAISLLVAVFFISIHFADQFAFFTHLFSP